MTGITRVGDVLAVAHELDEETAWARDGAPPELSPAVVTWLAQLALNHPQVSAAVAAALPTSGVRWAMPWTESDDGDATDVRAGVAGGRDLGRVTAGGLADWAWVTMGVHGRSGSRDAGRVTAGGLADWAWVTMGVHGRSGSRDAARAEVDERLLAAGYTLLGEVYRRAAREPVPCTRCASTGVVTLELGVRQVCGDCGGRGTVPRG